MMLPRLAFELADTKANLEKELAGSANLLVRAESLVNKFEGTGHYSQKRHERGSCYCRIDEKKRQVQHPAALFTT